MWDVFSSSVNAVTLNKALSEERDPINNNLKKQNLCNSLFDRVNGLGELLETSPVRVSSAPALRFLDVGIDRIADVTCSVYE